METTLPTPIQDSPRPAEIACPQCHAHVSGTADALRCERHGVVGSRNADGVWVFDSSNEYWGEVAREHMRRVNETARRAGWHQALHDHVAAESAGLAHYAENISRADWYTLLPLDRERTVSLDVGAGWGANSFGLAQHVHHHYAAEKIAERVEFIALRAKQDKVDNIVPVRADLHALPFATASLDVVAVNGVLEWAGLVDPDADPDAPRAPDALQRSFLRQLHALMRPGGWLYVGIENRYGRMFWRGAIDHQGLRYTSLMPRRAARAYTRARQAVSPRTRHVERDYRAWTYSLGGYLRLFERCGFVHPQVYAAVPGYNVPTRLVPLASRGPMRYVMSQVRSQHRGRNVARRILHDAMSASGLERALESCYAFVCRRPES